ncbi:tetratricopeptide repeat protein [Pigmentibacter sp. JX0631]|uniref:tetratricopeptide repeat protein n=1 Tax=Pigmentibacter sp. JX0631 TaxID=2976982 RepID=UPI002468BEB1|nr:tetratricopeptide repeat protein [Pigmentibacter sp. JX0631]WGL60422.1 tetratricopeptide repeat protein [Pigmentibacter sp. JX0631]
MKHLKDAKLLIEEGDSAGAMEVLENLLSLSPRNTEAIRMKAFILDAWGRFDESLSLLHTLGKLSSSEEEPYAELDKRIDEDRESLIYSRLTPEGRWYFQFSPLQMLISLIGLMGCFLFLITSPTFFEHSKSSIPPGLLFSFFTLVVIPWFMLLLINMHGIKKILVGLAGIQVFYGMKKIEYSWEQMGHVVIEYDPNLKEDYLHMIVYSRLTREPLFNFDISKTKSVVRARRHFVRLILSYIDTVSYVPRGKATNKEENTINSNNNKNDSAA